MKKRFLLPLIVTTMLVLFIGYGASSASDDAASGKSGFDKYLGQGKNTGEYWPTDDWRTCRPEEVGMDSEKLVKAIEYASTPKFKTEGLVVMSVKPISETSE
ncbi:MAG: hypothetical protein JRJ73_10630 [Deltaproteobacteria bacterium]|nr:hypothetical protein [Deltaproteobacteria bacterium]